MNLSLPTNSAIVSVPTIDGQRRPLLTPIPGSPGEFLLVIDNSSLEKFTTCPRSSEFYLVHNREAHAKNSALVFGGAIHIGIEALELGLPPSEQDRRMTKYMTDHPTPIGDHRTITIALQVLKHYRHRVEHFPDMQWTGLADSNGVQIIEQAFEIPLTTLEVNAHIDMPWLSPEELTQNRMLFPHIPDRPLSAWVSNIHVAWSGRIDRVVNCNGMDRVADHKTTSIKIATVAEEYHLSNPVLGYIWAGRKKYPHLNILGACMNFIYLQKPSGSGYPNASDLTARGPRGGEPPLDFGRTYYEFTEEKITWWENNVVQIISDFVGNLIRGYFPSHYKSCIGKYGKCQYRDVCLLNHEADQLRMLHSPMFSDVTWNPVSDR